MKPVISPKPTALDATLFCWIALIAIACAAVSCRVSQDRPRHPQHNNEVQEPAGADLSPPKPQVKNQAVQKFHAAHPNPHAITPENDTPDNEFNVLVNPNLTMEEVPAVMDEVLQEMAQLLPGEDITATVYFPSNPPTRIATARLDGNTGETTFTWQIPRQSEPEKKPTKPTRKPLMDI